jgi:hypothetical protein
VFYKVSPQINYLLLTALLAFNATAANNLRQLPEKGRFSITPEVGTFFNRDGKYVNGDATTAIVGNSRLPQIGGIVVSPGLRAKAENQSFGDVIQRTVDF